MSNEATPRVPRDRDIVGLYEKYETPENIRRHQQVVATVATIIAKNVASRGTTVNVGLVRAAGFLHDIGKIFQVNKDKAIEIQGLMQPGDRPHHTVYGLRILEKEGFHEIGRLVALHIGSLYARDPALFTGIEEKIVMVADMRVVEDRVVTLKNRVEYINQHYGYVFGDNVQILEKVEREILSKGGVGTGGALEREISTRGLETLGK